MQGCKISNAREMNPSLEGGKRELLRCSFGGGAALAAFADGVIAEADLWSLLWGSHTV